MYSYYLYDIWDFFYTQSLEKDKIEFQKFKAEEIIIWKKRAKIINFILSIVTMMVIVTSIFYFSKLSLFDFFKVAFFIIAAFAINNLEPKDFTVWKKFILGYIANQMSNHIQHDDGNKSIDGYHKLDEELKNYFMVRDYIFNRSNFNSADIRQLIDQLINYQAKNGEFRNAKSQQYRRDQYHYSAIMDEMKLRAIHDYETLFPSHRLATGFLFIWILIPIPTIYLVIHFNIRSWMIPETGGFVLTSIWLVAMMIFVIVRFYYRSKHGIIKKWENYFIKQGWEIFERPGISFAHWDALSKYATFYFQKRFANSIVKHIDK